MFVKATMTRNPLTVFPDSPVTEAQLLMRREKIHHLPVVDRRGKLVGIVTQKDLLNVSPSAATTLDMYEMTSLLAKLKVEAAMSRTPVTVAEDAPIEEAARLMADNDMGGLPVVGKDQMLVGIITESDIFHLFVDMLGSRLPGVRLTVLLRQKEGELAALAGAIAAKGGNIIATGTSPGTDSGNVQFIFKIQGIAAAVVRDAAQGVVLELVDIRES